MWARHLARGAACVCVSGGVSLAEGDKVKGAMVGDNFQYSLGTPESGFSIFLADRTKKIHFIRHAEGHHNVATKKHGSNTCLHRGAKGAAEHPLWDARLTQKGIAQAESLRAYLAERPSGGRDFTAFDLVVVSPLTRTCETAEHIFGPARAPGTPSFACNAGPRGVAAPRVLVREECRERWGEYVCDGRRPIREIMKEFPSFDWSEVEQDDDIYYSDTREPDPECCERAVEFLAWLNKRPEKCIAVVTHSSFLRHLFMQFGGTSTPDDRADLQRLAGNCELRSVVMCSHGVRDAQPLRNMKEYSQAAVTAPSTVSLEQDGTITDSVGRKTTRNEREKARVVAGSQQKK